MAVNLAVITTIAIAARYIILGIGIAVSHKGAYNALFKVRCMIVTHMANISLGHLNEKNTGDIKKVINEDIEKLELFLAHHISEIVMYLIGPLAVFLYLFKINVFLSIISLLPLPIAILIQFKMFSGQSSRMKDYNRVVGKLNSNMIEYISGMKLIKAYNMGVTSYEKYKSAIDEHHALWEKIAYYMSPLFAMFIVVLQSGIVALLPLGGFLYLNGKVGAGVFILFIFIGSLYLSELRGLMELGGSFSQVINGVKSVKAILDIPCYKESNQSFPNSYSIKLKDISFSYDGENNVLEDVNLHINQGEKVAIVGKSGAGKSTLVQLIARYYDVKQGQITIGERDIRSLDYNELLNNIAIVFQKTFLMNDTIYKNIQMNSDASPEQVKEAARKARIHNFIETLPNGYETKIGAIESGLSGGEKQRISIARAILKDAPILILDEATSAADPENQLEIERALDELCKGKTVIVVAHRLDIVKKCDRIAVIEKNSVSGIGTHEFMLKNNNYYSQIWMAYNQARNIQYDIKAGV